LGMMTGVLSSSSVSTRWWRKSARPDVGLTTPSMVCRLAAPRSASTMVTRWPSRASASARLAAIVLLPTPPLPPATAIVRVAARLSCATMAPPWPEAIERSLERRLDLLDDLEQGVEQRRGCSEVVRGLGRPARDVLRALELALREQRDERERLERRGEPGLEARQPIAGVAALDHGARDPGEPPAAPQAAAVAGEVLDDVRRARGVDRHRRGVELAGDVELAVEQRQHLGERPVVHAVDERAALGAVEHRGVGDRA